MLSKDHVSLFQYYGVKCSHKRVACTSVLDYNNIDLEFHELIENAVSASSSRIILLFISVSINNFYDRKYNISELLRKKYNLQCDTVISVDTMRLGVSIRLGCVSTSFDCFNAVIDILLKMQNHSFAVIANEENVIPLAEKLIDYFSNGIITPSTLAECCNYALSQEASFLHILSGYDGYSINWIYRMRDGLHEP